MNLTRAEAGYLINDETKLEIIEFLKINKVKIDMMDLTNITEFLAVKSEKADVDDTEFDYSKFLAVVQNINFT